MKRALSTLSKALVAAGLLGWGAAATAMTCDHARLKAASGVIGQKHSYVATANCHEEHSTSSTKLTWSGLTTTSVNTGFVIAIMGKATWERKTGLARENLVLSGEASGERVATGICDQDPFLRNPPGDPAVCHGVKAQYQSKSGPLYQVFIQDRFFLARTLDLAEAEALSHQGGAAPTPPAPAPAPKPKPVIHSLQSPSGTRVFEAERLFLEGKVHVTGGKAGVQPMQGYGPDWSGNAQLFWGQGQPGAVLALRVEVPTAGRYRVRAEFTRAPDFGRLRAEVAGQASDVTLEGYAPKVAHSQPVDLGTFQLPAGSVGISFQIVGKAPQASAYYAGIDRLLLTPVTR